MTTPNYFYNFAPCEAVQYDGTNADELRDMLPRGWFTTAEYPECFQFTHQDWPREKNINIHVNKEWLVRQGDRVGVTNEEPARVSHISRIIDAQCYDSRCDWCVEDRRYYVLTNGARIPVPVELEDDERSTP